MVEKKVDILIVGGGLTGATLMLALSGLGYQTLLIENTPFSKRLEEDFDARTIALAPASIHILDMLGLWSLLKNKATAIEKIHISEQGHFGRAELHSSPEYPLGYVVEMHEINHVLNQCLDHRHVIAPATVTQLNRTLNQVTIAYAGEEWVVQARLIVAADGADSTMRQLCGLTPQVKIYNQHAIVTNVGLSRAHFQQAFERFTRSGPLALLPMQDLRMSLVWALSHNEAQYLLEMNERDFLKALQLAFGYRAGRFVKIGRRVLFPLRQVTMSQQFIDSIVFVGNAAHTLHPVAGQGFNLGLRDVAMLAQCIIEKGLDVGLLETYQAARQTDQQAIIRFTDSLVTLFTSKIPGLAVACGMGLLALDNSTLLKNSLMRYATGFAGMSPDLVCKIPLPSNPSGRAYEQAI